MWWEPIDRAWTRSVRVEGVVIWGLDLGIVDMSIERVGRRYRVVVAPPGGGGEAFVGPRLYASLREAKEVAEDQARAAIEPARRFLEGEPTASPPSTPPRRPA